MTNDQAQFIAHHAILAAGLSEEFIRNAAGRPDFCEAVATIITRQRMAMDEVARENRDLRIRLDEVRKILAMRGSL